MPRVPEALRPTSLPPLATHASTAGNEPLFQKLFRAKLETTQPKEKYLPRDDLEGGLIPRDEALKRGFVLRPVRSDLEPENH